MLLLTLWLLLPACKTRQVQTNKSHIKLNTELQSITKSHVLSIDSQKIFSKVANQSILRDSAVLYIVSDSGKTQHVSISGNSTFTYNGLAKTITLKKLFLTNKISDSTFENTKAKSTYATHTDSTWKKQTLQLTKKSKYVYSKVGYSWIIGLVIIGLLASLVLLTFNKIIKL